VKICGVTREQDAVLAVSLGADMIGLNFYPPSPRSLTLEQARAIRCAAGKNCEVVGVFVNASRAYIKERLRELRLDYLQFHGDEDEQALAGWPVRVIRALRLGITASAGYQAQRPQGSPEGRLSALIESCTADYVLLDTYHPQLFGGTGRARPLRELDGTDLRRVFLSGGLSPANVALAAAFHPFAVDVASGVEAAPGIKDAAKLRSFIANAKSAG